MRPLQPTKNVIRFYTVYEGAATRYDEAFVKRHKNRLNLITVMVRPHRHPSLSHLT